MHHKRVHKVLKYLKNGQQMIRLCRKRLTFAPIMYLNKEKNEKEDIIDTDVGK